MNGRGPILGVFGTGGFSLEVLASIRNGKFRSNELDLSKIHSRRILKVGKPGEEFTGDDQILENEFLDSNAERYFVLAISDKSVRQKLAELALRHNAIPISLFDENSRISEDSQIDIGAILSPFSLISPNVEVGRFFHLNIYSYVAHDVKIGSYVTFGPKVSCNGNTIIQDNVYIGTGATLINGQSGKPLVVGESATIGMGAVVIRDVEPFSTVVGNPAREIAGSIINSDNHD